MREKYIINGVEISATSLSQAQRAYLAMEKSAQPTQHGKEIQRAKRTQPYGA